jgi:hypothetical protein
VERQVSGLGDGRDGVDFSQRIDGADLGCLGDCYRRGTAVVDGIFGEACDPLCQVGRIDLAGGAFDGRKAGLAEEIRRAAFVLDHMGFGMTEGDATRTLDACERQRVGSGAGGHEEDGDVAFEDFRKARLDAPVEIAGAIGSGKTCGFLQQAFGDGTVGASPVVGSKEHENDLGKKRAGRVRSGRLIQSFTGSSGRRASHHKN